MAKHTNKIWRTVVFSGAMLMTPLAGGCGGGSKKADTTPATPVTDPATVESADKAESDKAASEAAAKEIEAAATAKAAEDQRLLAEQEAADKKAAEELAAKEAADKKAADEAAAAKKPRPRTTTKNRPTGRGFILS